MTTRITQSMLTTNVLADLNNITSQLQQTQNELSSGKSILKPSDDPFGTARALQYRADLAANQQKLPVKPIQHPSPETPKLTGARSRAKVHDDSSTICWSIQATSVQSQHLSLRGKQRAGKST